MSALANALAMAGRYKEAYNLYDQLLDISTATMGAASEKLLPHIINFATACLSGGEIEKACQVLDQVWVAQ
jgi:hypothetical protein